MILESELNEYTCHYEFMFDNFFILFFQNVAILKMS